MTAATRRGVAEARAAAHDVPEADPALRVEPEAVASERLAVETRMVLRADDVATPAAWARAIAVARLATTARTDAQAVQDAVTDLVTTCACRAHARPNADPVADARFDADDQEALMARADPVDEADFFAWAEEVATSRDVAAEVAVLTVTPDVDGTAKHEPVTYRTAAEDCQAHARPYDRPDAEACLRGEVDEDDHPNALEAAEAALRAEPAAAGRPRIEPTTGILLEAVSRTVANA